MRPDWDKTSIIYERDKDLTKCKNPKVFHSWLMVKRRIPGIERACLDRWSMCTNKARSGHVGISVPEQAMYNSTG
jgi:hypothetical protein